VGSGTEGRHVIVKSLFTTIVVQAFTAKEHVSGGARVTIHVRSSDKTDSPAQLMPDAARKLAAALLDAAEDADDPIIPEDETDP
jgi:hypothetical protein